MRSLLFVGAIIMAGVLINGCATNPFPDKAPVEYVRAELAKLAPVELEIDLAGLSDGDLKALAKLLEASKIIDELFLLQVDPNNPHIRQELTKANLNDHLALFDVMFGKWNRLAEDKPFLDLEEKPLGAGFYPADMSKEEFDAEIINSSRKIFYKGKNED